MPLSKREWEFQLLWSFIFWEGGEGIFGMGVEKG